MKLVAYKVSTYPFLSAIINCLYWFYVIHVGSSLKPQDKQEKKINIYLWILMRAPNLYLQSVSLSIASRRDFDGPKLSQDVVAK